MTFEQQQDRRRRVNAISENARAVAHLALVSHAACQDGACEVRKAARRVNLEAVAFSLQRLEEAEDELERVRNDYENRHHCDLAPPSAKVES